MPHTINGIGTTYYGKKNVETFSGVCESCHREVMLSSYETKLWFTVVYIPVIPLGRKQILNYCPVCTRHRTLPLQEWESIKSNAIDEQRSLWNQDRSNPKTAIEYLQTLAAFRQEDEASKTAEILGNDFPENAEVQAALGQWWANVDRMDRAETCFQRSLELEPSNLAARHALACLAIAKDDPLSADRLLRQSPPIAAIDDPALHYQLGLAYRRQGRNAEALAEYRSVIAASPALAKLREVRKEVRETEQALGEFESILPTQSIFGSKPFWIATAALIAIAAIIGWNWTIANGRHLHVVNGTKMSFDVEFENGTTATVGPQGRTEVKLAEGTHRARVLRNGEELQAVDFTISSNWFDRFFKSPVFVLNPLGAAPILMERATYADVPREDDNSFQVTLNQSYLTYPDVDYVFAQFPNQLKMKRGTTVTKSRVDMLTLEPSDVCSIPEIPDQDKLTYAETHLKENPADGNLLPTYVALAQSNDCGERAIKFLADGLDYRPVAIEWHRGYQELQHAADREQLCQQYREFLNADPDNGSLMYLLGRIEPDRDVANRLFDQSIKADPALWYPWYAKAYQHLSDCDLDAARAAIDAAMKIDPENPQIQASLFQIRLATGDYRQLEAELRLALVDKPMFLPSVLQMMQIHAAKGQFDEVQRVRDSYVQTYAAQMPESLRGKIVEALDMSCWYYCRNFDEMLEFADNNATAAPRARFIALLELGRFDEAAQALELEKPSTDRAYAGLCLAIAYRVKQEPDKAGTWEEAAIRDLIATDGESGNIVDAIRRSEEITPADVRRIVSAPNHRAILLVALAQRSASHRQAFLELAEKLNFTQEFPRHFIADAIAKTRTSQ